MSSAGSFVNLHPFFVHAPLVLIPVAAVLVWLGRRIRKEGFDTATLLLTVAAALGALAAIASGWAAEASVPASDSLRELMDKHKVNGVVVTMCASIAALLAVAEWWGWLDRRWWWSRAGLLTFAAIGVIFSGQTGAEMVYLHGAAVVPVVENTKAEPLQR